MFELAGENYEGANNCPGEPKCDIFAAAYGENHEEKFLNACFGCPMEDTKQFADNSAEENLTDEIEHIVADIEDIISWENASFKTDWSCYDFAIQKLVKVWRKAEREIEAIQNGRLQAVLKSFFKT